MSSPAVSPARSSSAASSDSPAPATLPGSSSSSPAASRSASSPVTWSFVDDLRRTFLALSRDGSYYHLVHPAAATDLRVSGWRRDGELVIEPKVSSGELVCECASGRIRGTCYVVQAALERLSVDFTSHSEGAGSDVDGRDLEVDRG